jgi:hypothetical protein
MNEGSLKPWFQPGDSKGLTAQPFGPGGVGGRNSLPSTQYYRHPSFQYTLASPQTAPLQVFRNDFEILQNLINTGVAPLREKGLWYLDNSGIHFAFAFYRFFILSAAKGFIRPLAISRHHKHNNLDDL